MAAQREGGHPAKRTFQALRIAVNNELDIIAPTLKTLCEISREGGRVAVLTFHSLEDRIVKQTFAELSSGCTCPPSPRLRVRKEADDKDSREKASASE